MDRPYVREDPRWRVGMGTRYDWDSYERSVQIGMLGKRVQRVRPQVSSLERALGTIVLSFVLFGVLVLGLLMVQSGYVRFGTTPSGPVRVEIISY